MMETFTLVRDQGRILIQEARRRRLGSLFVPIRRSYLVVFPLILLVCGILGFAVQTDFTMIFDALVLTAIASYIAYDLLSEGAPLRVSTIFALTLGLAYGLGTVNTWFTLPRTGETLAFFLNLDGRNLAEAEALILIAIALMLAVGELFEKPIFGEEFSIKFSNRDIVIVTLGALFRAVTFASGRTIAFTSQSNIQQGHAGAIAILSGDIEAPCLALAFCMALNAETRAKRWYLYLLTLLLFLLDFPNGRRAMIYGILLMVIAARLGRFRIRISFFKKITAAILLSGLLYVATLGFYYVRVASYSETNPSLSERVTGVIALIKEKKNADVDQQFSSNIQGRTFILTFIGKLVGETAARRTGHGIDMMNQFEAAIPTAIYPSRDVFFTEESLASQLFGTQYGDEPNSVISAGIIDFGILGLILYPLFFSFLLRYFIEVVGDIMPLFACCFVILLVLAAVLEPETDISEYFLVIREGILTGSAVWALAKLPAIQLWRHRF
jgi:hypothetical protein